MPTNLEDTETGGTDLLFADSLPGTQFQLREAAVWDAEELREELGQDIPKFGRWLPVETEDGPAWMVGLGELIQELQRYEEPVGNLYEVTRAEKAGERESDPYEVNVEQVTDDGQARL